MTWNLQNVTLTDEISPMDGVSVGKLFLQKNEYICVIKMDNGKVTTLGQLTEDEFSILSGNGEVTLFPREFMASLGRKWLLCSSKEGAKNEFSEEDLCSFWVYRVIEF